MRTTGARGKRAGRLGDGRGDGVRGKERRLVSSSAQQGGGAFGLLVTILQGEDY